MTEMVLRRHVHALTLSALALACACGVGGRPGDGSDGSVSTTSSGTAETTGVDAPASLGGEELPFSGTLTLDEHDWIDLGTDPDELGVIRVELPSGSVRRFLAGYDGAQHQSNGNTVFSQFCEDGASRVVMADGRGAVNSVLTPCSNEFIDPSCCIQTTFDKPVLSPDGTRVAVEVRSLPSAFVGYEYLFSIAVFDTEGNRIGRDFGGWAPAWTPDGRLVFGSSDGLYLTDGDFTESMRVDRGELTGVVFGPKVHPGGDRILFEYNQRIWEINLDGSALQEVAFGSARLSSPAYSPDGAAIVFIASESERGALIYLKNLGEDEYYPLDIRSQLSSSGVPGGPISWTP